MGNALTFNPCIRPSEYSTQHSSIKLVSPGGATTWLTRKTLAGEFPGRIVCHADSFIIGQSIPSLAIDDELIKGQTYFLLPLDFFAHNVLTVSSVAALVSGTIGKSNWAQINFKGSPFEYLKGSNGRVLIKVVPEFITRVLITRGNSKKINGDDQMIKPNNYGFLCNTPELKKHYSQLVGSRDQVWSPKLDTISECRNRFSPCRFLGFERKDKEIEY